MTKAVKMICRAKAQKVVNKHNKQTKGFRKILVPHPTVPHTYIEKLVPDEKN